MGFSDMRTVRSKKFGVTIEYYDSDIYYAITGPGCEEAYVFGCGYEDGRAYNLCFVPDDDEWESYHYDDSKTELLDEEE